MNFTLCSGYFCISRNILEFYSETLLSDLEVVWHFQCLFLCLVRWDQSKIYLGLILLHYWGSNLWLFHLMSYEVWDFFPFWMKHRLFLPLSEPLGLFPLLLLVLFLLGVDSSQECGDIALERLEGDPLQINPTLSLQLSPLWYSTRQILAISSTQGYCWAPPRFLLPLLPGNSKQGAIGRSSHCFPSLGLTLMY